MNRFIILGTLLIAFVSTTANGKSVTFYTDGIIVEQEVTAVKGILEIPLPPGTLKNSLRIKPGKGTVIHRVDIMQTQANQNKAEKDLDILLEQKNRLGDRLEALATREEIFKAAAKSQSAKAPRKSKSNPEPMQSIRQGTEFAIAQLEAVYTARRKAEQEVRRLESRIAAAKSNGQPSESLAKITVSPLRGGVIIRYAVIGKSWTPRYDMYLNGSGSAQVTLSGQFPETFTGYLIHVSPSLLTNSETSRLFSLQTGSLSRINQYKLAVTEEVFGTGLLSYFAFELKNTEPCYLPAGEATIYRNGEYIGKVLFEGLSSGHARKVYGGGKNNGR